MPSAQRYTQRSPLRSRRDHARCSSSHSRFRPAHHVRRQAFGVVADQRRKRLAHLARRDALQIQPGDRGVQRTTPANVRRHQSRAKRHRRPVAGCVSGESAPAPNRFRSRSHAPAGIRCAPPPNDRPTSLRSQRYDGEQLRQLGLHRNCATNSLAPAAQNLRQLVPERTSLLQRYHCTVCHGVPPLLLSIRENRSQQGTPPHSTPIHEIRP